MIGRFFAGALVSVVAGIAAGLGGYTFVYARGYSYLTNDPEACVNCHIMREHFDGWSRSSHHAVAVCNDCHAPAGLVRKLWVKGENGFWHSYAFTSGRFHEPIQIRAKNTRVAEESCRRCHAEIVEAMDGPHRLSGALSCVRCHGAVGHPR